MQNTPSTSSSSESVAFRDCMIRIAWDKGGGEWATTIAIAPGLKGDPPPGPLGHGIYPN